MSKQIKFEDIRIGDRVRITLPGDRMVLEFVVAEHNLSAGSVGDERFFTLYVSEIEEDPYATIELLERALEPEPTGVGAVVEFHDPLESIEHVAVRTRSGVWLDEDLRAWGWDVIAANLGQIVSRGVHVD